MKVGVILALEEAVHLCSNLHAIKCGISLTALLFDSGLLIFPIV